MNERTANDGDLLEEELVAYLDGELPDVDRARIERRLADDVSCQRKLAQLQKAWDLLDMLQKSEPDAEFTRSTVEMVAVQQEQEAELLQSTVKRSQVAWIVGGGLAIALSLAGGFFLARYQLEAPERQLLQDLPVIERVDQYRHAESVEFLESLRQEGLFAGEGDDAI
jgi:anti-sigma factor RsiW